MLYIIEIHLNKNKDLGLLSLENVSMFAVSIKMVIEKLWDMGIKPREVFFLLFTVSSIFFSRIEKSCCRNKGLLNV